MLDLFLIEHVRGGLVIWVLLHVLSPLEVSEYALVAQCHPNLVLLLVVVVDDFLFLEFDTGTEEGKHQKKEDAGKEEISCHDFTDP